VWCKSIKIQTAAMKSYFIRQDNKPQGPYSLDQLKEMKLNPAVLVWAEGLKQWIKALEIPELHQELFPTPPQSAAKNSASGIKTPEFTREKKANAFAKNVKTFLAVIALIIATLLLIELKKSKTHSAAAVKTVNQPIQTAANQTALNQSIKTSPQVRKDDREKEVENPVAFIKGQISWRKNLVGSMVLEGTLSNTATLANFKDPVILVTWLSKSNESIGTTQYSVNKYLPAGETISYKLKVSAPSKIADVRMSVVSASPAQ
jgi:hypothetical protein